MYSRRTIWAQGGLPGHNVRPESKVGLKARGSSSALTSESGLNPQVGGGDIYRRLVGGEGKALLADPVMTVVARSRSHGH